MRFKEILKVTGIPVLVASLCCLAPIVVLLGGVGTVTVASTLADTLYGEYKWLFRLAGLALLAIALLIYLRSKGVCTLDDAKRRRQEVLNIIMLSLFAGIVGYIVFLYVIVHYAGVFLGLWA